MIGIYLMGFVILVSGVGALGMSIAYVVRPSEGKLALMRPLSLASIFAAICSFTGGLVEVLNGLSATLMKKPGTAVPSVDMSAVSAGLAESLLPLFIAFAFLAVAWLLVAAGLNRRA